MFYFIVDTWYCMREIFFFVDSLVDWCSGSRYSRQSRWCRLPDGRSAVCPRTPRNYLRGWPLCRPRSPAIVVLRSTSASPRLRIWLKDVPLSPVWNPCFPYRTEKSFYNRLSSRFFLCCISAVRRSITVFPFWYLFRIMSGLASIYRSIILEPRTRNFSTDVDAILRTRPTDLCKARSPFFGNRRCRASIIVGFLLNYSPCFECPPLPTRQFFRLSYFDCY